MKNRVLAALLVASAPLGLTACGSADDGDVMVQEDPNTMAGMAVENARLVLPAVAGNPGAIYFDVKYDGDAAAMIRRIDVAGAETAALHETMEMDGTASMQEVFQMRIPKGGEKFEPGGKHVMAMGLSNEVEAGDVVEVTLTFVGGKKTSFPAEVRAAGDGDGGKD